MKKSDLKTGMRVRMRDGSISLVVCDVLIDGKKDILFAFDDGGWMDGSSYKDNLTVKECEGYEDDEEFDIMEVYLIDERKNNFTNNFMKLNKRYSIWKREEYTDEQKEVFKALRLLGFNWIAKDNNGELYAYKEKPHKTSGDKWIDNKLSYIYLSTLDKNLFDFIKWEDNEPFEIPTL